MEQVIHPEQAQNRAQARLLETLERLTDKAALPFDAANQDTRFRNRIDVWVKANVPPEAIEYAEHKAHALKVDFPLAYFVGVMNEGMKAMWGVWADDAPGTQEEPTRWRKDSRFEHLFNQPLPGDPS